MNEGEYETVAFCCNCSYEGPVTAPVGEPVYTQPCPLCLCKMLQPVARREWDGRVTDGIR